MTEGAQWQRFNEYFLHYKDLGFMLDVSRMRFESDFIDRMRAAAARAFEQMVELEKGAVANPDEGRMVGHYWLRAPELAPDEAMRREIQETHRAIREFAAEVHGGKLGRSFTDVLIIGIGGSALGPQLVADALGSGGDALAVRFFDNTDPDGFERVLEQLDGRLVTTLPVVISKSGGTKETRNGMLEASAAWERAGLDFSENAIAVTGEGSELDKVAREGGWLRRFPMWDWVGGRTSLMSAVGLLPAALQAIDINALLAGAAAMDERTRVSQVEENASMLLALMWHYAGNGRGEKDMVILPYKDRLTLFSKYLQQLVMESLGKRHDLDGNVVNQGIAVYGNKGSTDQHAYVQQLRDGVANFFGTFIEVRKDRDGGRFEVEPGVTSGDYLHGFLRGTRTALYEGGRDSITISIAEVSPFTLGMLIALYERAVGFYASLVNINAYHQPGVEAGKKAAAEVLTLQAQVVAELKKSKEPRTAAEIASAVGGDVEAVYHLMNHLAANTSDLHTTRGTKPEDDRFA